MTILSLAILAIVQGITEFLPVSSSGHLLLLHSVMDQGVIEAAHQKNLLIDVAVHVGTLFSVLLYFQKDLMSMLCGAKDVLSGNTQTPKARLDIYILISSIPVIIAGFAMHYFAFFWGNAVTVVAWTTLLFGVLLWLVDAIKPNEKKLEHMNIKHAIFIGLAQAIALIPGTSRSGITMTAARSLGYTRTEAARYSLLLAIIAISGAGTIGLIQLINLEDPIFTTQALIAMALAFIAGWVSISLMMKWLERASFKIFAVYRIILGLGLLSIAYFDVFV